MALGKLYKFYYKPAYRSKEMLLQFIFDHNDPDFFPTLVKALDEIKPEIKNSKDIWMNDEIVLIVDSQAGSFLLSKDVWGFAFIMAEHNQECIAKINNILISNPHFYSEGT